VVSAQAAEPGYGIVQLQPGKVAREALEAGRELYGYLPDNAFQVRLDAPRALLAALPRCGGWVSTSRATSSTRASGRTRAT
jgi:hypothetical protein